MKKLPQSILGVAICALANGCVSVAPAPGADRVQFIRKPSGCSNVHCGWQRGLARWSRGRAQPDCWSGGNAIFPTMEQGGTVVTGVAYRCPQ